jgi:hypothetical protein
VSSAAAPWWAARGTEIMRTPSAAMIIFRMGLSSYFVFD